MKGKAVEVTSLDYQIGGQPILRDVSFSVCRGESVSIIGSNGAGKTTLLKCLNRILPSRRDSVRILSRPLEGFRQSDLAKVVSYVPQAGDRSLPFTAFEFVLMGRYPYFSPFTSIGRKDQEAARNALILTGTEGLEGRFLNTLSGGECQKVFIAAALAQTAEVLLLDEPTTFLDPKHQTEILRILAHAQRETGVTILTVTHDLNSAALRSDRIVALKQGSVAFDGRPDEIMNNEILGHIYDLEFDFLEDPASDRVLAMPRIG